MNEEIQFVLDSAEEQMSKAISHLEYEFTNIRAGKASPIMLKSVMVNYYGASTPLSQVANVNTMDAHTLTVQPWEKHMLNEIAKAIMEANLGLNPQNNGDLIIISVPMLTEERRKELVKVVRELAENARIAVRNIRRDANNDLKTLAKDKDISEDEEHRGQDLVQQVTNQSTDEIESLLQVKEKELMEI